MIREIGHGIDELEGFLRKDFQANEALFQTLITISDRKWRSSHGEVTSGTKRYSKISREPGISKITL